MSAQGSTATSGCQFLVLEGGMNSHPTSTTENTARNPSTDQRLLYLPTSATRLPIPKMPAIQGRKNSGSVEHKIASVPHAAIARRIKRRMILLRTRVLCVM